MHRVTVGPKGYLVVTQQVQGSTAWVLLGNYRGTTGIPVGRLQRYFTTINFRGTAVWDYSGYNKYQARGLPCRVQEYYWAMGMTEDYMFDFSTGAMHHWDTTCGLQVLFTDLQTCRGTTLSWWHFRGYFRHSTRVILLGPWGNFWWDYFTG